MGAHFHVELTLQAAHRIAVDEASAWRGRCINLFARAERVVAVAISANKKSAKTQLFGKRLGLLADAMADDPSILAVIESLQSLVETRNTIVHCEGHVFVDLKGHWKIGAAKRSSGYPSQKPKFCDGQSNSLWTV